eukprot:6199833-Pleurochrysis_carterae.AAC.1
MLKLFIRWKRNVGYGQGESPDKGKGTEVEETEGGETEKTYGIQHWGRVRTVPRIQLGVKNFLQKGMGASGLLRLTSSFEELLSYHIMTPSLITRASEAR